MNDASTDWAELKAAGWAGKDIHGCYTTDPKAVVSEATLRASCEDQLYGKPTPAPAKVWVVTAPSAIHMGVCFLGRGATRAAAIADAYGPTPNRKSMRIASIYETTADEADQLEEGVY
jgi:hypothetical protein